MDLNSRRRATSVSAQFGLGYQVKKCRDLGCESQRRKPAEFTSVTWIVAISWNPAELVTLDLRVEGENGIEEAAVWLRHLALPVPGPPMPQGAKRGCIH